VSWYVRLGIVCLLAGMVCAGVIAGAHAAARAGFSPSAVTDIESPSVPGTPTVPLSVTAGRTFTVTGPLSAGDSGPVTLACYHNVSGVWLRAGSVLASTTTQAAGPGFSANVSLDAPGTWVIRAEEGEADAASASVSATSAPVRVSTQADAIVWNRDGVLTLPERMSYRGDARQLIITTAANLRSRTGTVAVFEYRSGDWVQLLASPCRLGRNGLIDGRYRHRGTRTTPTGIWVMPGYVFGQRAKRPSDTSMPYRHVTKFNWWSSEKGSQYNRWVWSRRRVDGEHLIDYPVHYEYAVSTGYNAAPNSSVFGRGAGIFLHVWKGATTSGCVSVPRATMQRVFRLLDPSKRRVFVVGTLADGPTSVYAY
jgi:L,D-peptidoglycan transpeptidase YkuD (ErfK/YbiS/YcfS/YnhG family)